MSRASTMPRSATRQPPWIESQFAGPAAATATATAETTATTQEAMAAAMRRRGKARNGSRSKRGPWTKQPPVPTTGRSSPSASTEDAALWERWQPTSAEALAVNKKKVDELRAWLSHFFSTRGTPAQGPNVLLLIGPSGCGKSATLRVLSRELKCEVVEWINPVSHQTINFDYSGEVRWQSQRARFEQFLLRSRKYRALAFGGPPTNKQLILVKDLPNYLSMHREAPGFHDLLRHYNASKSAPLVFVLTEEHLGSLGSSTARLFPTILETQGVFSTVRFNPIAPSRMEKALQTICTKAKIDAPRESIKAIVEQAGGDMRTACNSLQFLHRPRKGAVLTRHTRRRRGKRNSRSSSSASGMSAAKAIRGRDTSMKLFHAVGRILRARRKPQVAEDALTSQETRPKTPKFLTQSWSQSPRPSQTDSPSETGPATPVTQAASQALFASQQQPIPRATLPPGLEHMHRDPLDAASTPEDTLRHAFVSPQRFSQFLHQNYVDYFSNFDDLLAAADAFSSADLLTANELSTNSTVGSDYFGFTLTRELVFHNTQPLTARWRPLRKPVDFEAARSLEASRQEMRRVLRAPGLAAKRHSSALCTEREALLDVIPYLRYASAASHLNPNQHNFVGTLTHFAHERSVWRPASFTDRDRDVVSEDDNDDDDGDGDGDVHLDVMAAAAHEQQQQQQGGQNGNRNVSRPSTQRGVSPAPRSSYSSSKASTASGSRISSQGLTLVRTTEGRRVEVLPVEAPPSQPTASQEQRQLPSQPSAQQQPAADEQIDDISDFTDDSDAP